MKMGVQWGSGFGGCQGGCERERRIEVIVKIKKKNIRGGGSGQDGCERRINFFVKMQKNGEGGWWSGCRELGWM